MTLLKKWDFWFWLLYIIALYFAASSDPHLGQTNNLGTNTISTNMFFLGLLTILPVLLAYVAFKIIEKCIIHIRLGQDKVKYSVLLIVVIIAAGMLEWNLLTLWF